MDYSPYKRRSGFGSRKSGASSSTFLVFLISSIVGFLLFWGIKSFIFEESGAVVSAQVQKNSSIIEVMISGLNSWSGLRASEESRDIIEGDKIRIKKGNDALVSIENGSKIFLGLGSEVEVKNLRKNKEAQLYGNISVDSAPVIFSLQGNFDKTEELKIWVDKNVYIRGEKGKFLVTNTSVDMIEGDKINAFLTTDEGKISETLEFGIGQSLNITSFSIQAIPEKSKHLPLYQLYIAPPSTVGDDEIPNSSEIEIIASPQIIVPGNGEELIQITSVPQTISGTAPQEAEKIIVEFEDEKGNLDPYVLKNFNGEDKNWKYIASPSFETIATGKNIYRIYAVTASGEKSKPSTIIIQYTASENTQNIFTNAKGSLSITSPNGGGNTTQINNIIALRGTAPSNAVYVTVINSTLGSSYTLKQFQKGNKTWKYQTGAMDPGTYKYIVKAQAANRKTLASDTITITVSDSRGISTPTPSTSSVEIVRSPTPSPTPTPVATSIPVVSSEEINR